MATSSRGHDYVDASAAANDNNGRVLREAPGRDTFWQNICYNQNMKITKFGHCCMLIEEGELRILTDPGIYSVQQNNVRDIDVVLITHEHADHFHIDSVKEILKNNPSMKIITNSSVGELLKKENISFDIVEDGQSTQIKEVLIEGIGKLHGAFHSSIPQIQNTGYFIADRLFYPGDALTNPVRSIEILALPVAGLWLKLPEAIDYAIELKPKKCFPVHEGILQNPGTVHRLPPPILAEHDILFTVLEIDKEYHF